MTAQIRQKLAILDLRRSFIAFESTSIQPTVNNTIYTSYASEIICEECGSNYHVNGVNLIF